jgi:hypothetical protein
VSPAGGFQSLCPVAVATTITSSHYLNMQETTTNFHLITVKRLGATNEKGTRVKITSELFAHDSITLPYNYEYDTVKDIAINKLKDTHDIVGSGETKNGYVLIISSTFEPLNS